jgi:hypothetical protein
VGSSAEKSLRHVMAAEVMHSRHDSRKTTANARAKFLAQFEEQVDPDRDLPETERLRRAEHARRAHMLRLSYKSVQARRARKAAS